MVSRQVSKECLKQLKVLNDGKSSKEKFSELLNVIKVCVCVCTVSKLTASGINFAKEIPIA